jgi:hypothetical protein
MEQEKIGIDVVKLAVKFGCQFGMALEKSLEDGRLGVEDVGHFLPVFMQNANGMAQYKQLPAQIKDMDAEEAKELIKYCQDELNLANDGLEEKIERSLQACVVLLDLAKLFKK